ncbi:HIT family protein [Aliikangiella sp. G2MR2-5]|uniref:HIT family protein n=1 Tax=Aliikangiella sp. G2MR2-5 TaxID=2788943 RepID=UPI0018AA9212
MEATVGCDFCQLVPSRVLDESECFVVIRDAFPVTEGHTLFISKCCVVDWFALSDDERVELNQLIVNHKRELQNTFPEITGFNIGMNCGESAGQTVMHFHAHLIPRRENDSSSPRGGVRGVIPQKQGY